MNVKYKVFDLGGNFMKSARTFIQWHFRNGDTCKWGSRTELHPPATVEDIEKVSLLAAEATLEEFSNKLSLFRKYLIAVRDRFQENIDAGSGHWNIMMIKDDINGILGYLPEVEEELITIVEEGDYYHLKMYGIKSPPMKILDKDYYEFVRFCQRVASAVDSLKLSVNEEHDKTLKMSLFSHTIYDYYTMKGCNDAD